ncbi:MAG: cupin domain-containing protein [Deltaproteobacteria bacterium]|nr:cupin domain-containing protein [Deltaproteobacteria bacterium]
MDSEHKLTRWPEDRMLPSRRDMEDVLYKEGWKPFRMVDPPCTYYHTKCHDKSEVRWVIRGQILVGLEKCQIMLSIGDRLELQAGTPHWVRILSDDGAVYLLASR